MNPPKIFATPRRKWMFAGLIALGTLQAALAAGAALALAMFLSAPTGDGRAAILLIAGAAVAGLFVHAWSRSRAEQFGQQYVSVYRVRLLKAFVRAGGRNGRYGLTMTRLIADLASIKNWVARGIAEGAVNTTALIVFVSAAAAFAPMAVPAILVVIFLSGAIIGISSAPLRKSIRATRAARGRLAAKVGEAILIAPTLRMFGGLDAEKRRIYWRSDAVAGNMAARWWWATLARRAPEFAAPLGMAWLFATASLAEAASGAILLAGVATALRALAQATDYRLSYLEGAARLAQGLESSGHSAVHYQVKGPVKMTALDTRITAGDKRSNFAISAGDRIQIAASVATSMLLDVAAGLAPPSSGRITFAKGGSGKESGDLVAHRTAGVAVLVAPRAVFRRGTAYANIRAAAPDASDERIAEIAARCDLLRSGETAVDGLSWRIAESGRNLDASRAARLRLMIAVVASPGLLLIDDPVFEIDEAAGQALRRIEATEGVTILIAVFGDAPPIRTNGTLTYAKRRHTLSGDTHDLAAA